MPNTTISLTKANSDALALANSVEELLAGVCSQFRPCLRRVLTELRDYGQKASHAQEALRSFHAHQAAGTFPPALNSLHPPLLQCSKEFTASSNGRSAFSEVKTLTEAARASILAQFINAKEKEIAFFTEEYISKDKAKAAVLGALQAAGNAITSTFGSEADIPDVIGLEYDALKKLAVYYGARAVALGFAHHHVSLERKMKKLAVKESTDLDMTDHISTATIEKVVEGALKRHSQSLTRKRKNTGEFPLNPSITQATPESARAWKKARYETTEVQHPGSKSPSQDPAQTPEEKRGESRRERAKREEEREVQEMMDSRPFGFSVRNGASYPDSFISASPSSRVSFVALNSSLAFLSSVRTADPGVFKGVDVFIPPKIEYFLSLNLKHNFTRRLDLSLPVAAFTQLERSVRIKYFFRGQQDDNFIPLFHMRSNWEPPEASPSIEIGLLAGKAELLNQIEAMSPNHLTSENSTDMTIRARECREFLRVNQLLVLNSDKNLGCTVVTKSWYINAVNNHISNGPYSLRNIEDPTASILAAVNELPLHIFGERIRKFVLHPGHKYSLPRFHGIPKIHKEPWTIRPISPAHSWATTPLAKVVNHFLSPILAHFPTVCTSTISFVRSLRQVVIPKLSSGQRVVLCKGDVKAMYTNIPLDELLLVVEAAMEKFMPMYSSELTSLIIESIKLINTNSFFIFQDSIYHQENGLAMGSPIAPTLATLYMAWNEYNINRQMPNTVGTYMPFYRRYIDDIYAICIAEEDEPPHFVHEFMADCKGLEVIWEYSDKSSQFLDVRIWLEPGNPPSLHTCLWEKKLSHYQYIPWSTAHPRTVLKGFIKAELLRILVVCSEQESFCRFRQQFFYNLHRRGYPIAVLKKWFEPVKWSQRNLQLDCGKTKISETMLMLPSHYNPIWDYILVRKVEEVMRRSWSNCGIDDNYWLHKSKIITSFSRVRNLFDYTRSWNQATMESEPLVSSLESPEENISSTADMMDGVEIASELGDDADFDYSFADLLFG